MYLDDVVAAQKRGEATGIPSVCSAHPVVIQQTLRVFAEHARFQEQGMKTLRVSPLIEATCNQVNQFGGYTGMTPAAFVQYVRGIAQQNHFPFENIIVGGDHLGPSVWQHEPAEVAMAKAQALVRDCVRAGFTKIHLDCSMRLADDPARALDVEVSARRAAQLAKVAEGVGAEWSRTPPAGAAVPEWGHSALRYVIGTEVPIPGGALGQEETVRVTKVEEARQTLEVTREAFLRAGLAGAWENVIGLVVQPGVEFGDELIHPYQSEAARELSKFIESQPLIYEAHSTDYQTPEALRNLVRDHFAILKVGPALTFAYREAVFALARIEEELSPEAERSQVVQVLEEVMLQQPEHWSKYYNGNESEQAFKRKYSLSDRIRYYWVQPEVRHALKRLMHNLGDNVLPDSLLKEFAATTDLTAAQLIHQKIDMVLQDYLSACGYSAQRSG
jgi:D-tagatose-1,6-bisphosphate aldolase subunit GatZ/KbaZ